MNSKERVSEKPRDRPNWGKISLENSDRVKINIGWL